MMRLETERRLAGRLDQWPCGNGLVAHPAVPGQPCTIAATMPVLSLLRSGHADNILLGIAPFRIP